MTEEYIVSENEEIENIIDDAEEQDKYLKSESIINSISDTVTWSSDWTIETINSQIYRKNINLTPGFQRRDAWNIDKKSRFIESLFLGLPIPQLVLAEDNTVRGKYIVVDGKQRLTTISQFINDEFKPKDTVYNFLNNTNFSGIKANMPNEADFFINQTIRSVILKNWKSDNLLYSIFYRLNSGSLPLSPQELRAALKPGPLMEFIASYAETSIGIRHIFKRTIPDPRMKDVELILRYISFSLFSNNYDGNFKEFLDSTCDYFNADWDARKEQLFITLEKFEDSVMTCAKIFSGHEFRRINLNGIPETRFSRAVFDVQTFYLNSNLLNGFDFDLGDVFSEYVSLSTQNQDFYRSISSNTNNIQNTSTRFVIFGRLIEKITGLKDIVPSNLLNIYESTYAQR